MFQRDFQPDSLLPTPSVSHFPSRTYARRRRSLANRLRSLPSRCRLAKQSVREQYGCVLFTRSVMSVSAKTIERVVHDVGRELAERRDADPKTDEALAHRPESPPELAVVECDGGRIRTREPGHGPGVHRDGEGWRETKNACLIRAQRTISPEDPQPEPPPCFCDPKHVAKIAETEALSVASAVPPPEFRPPASESSEAADLTPPADWHPKRLVRTVLSSMAESKDFGKQNGGKPNGDGSPKRPPKRFWAMDYLGTGRFGNNTLETSRRSSISFTC